MKLFKRTLAVITISFLGLFALAPVATVGAADALDGVCDSQKSSNSICDNKDDNANDVVNVVVNTILFLVVAVAVLMIIIGGIRYAVSGGNAASVTAAKNTILYSVVGLVVALLAYALVNWVFNRF